MIYTREYLFSFADQLCQTFWVLIQTLNWRLLIYQSKRVPDIKDGRDIGRSVPSINFQQFCRGHRVSTGFIKLCRSCCNHLWLMEINLPPWIVQMKSNNHENILFINLSIAFFVFIYFLLPLIIQCFWMSGTVLSWNIYFKFIIITYIEIIVLKLQNWRSNPSRCF